MATQSTNVLVRNTDGRPALWLDICRAEFIDDAGNRSVSYEGTTLNDENTSVAFDPSVEDEEMAAEDWKRATA